MKKKTIRCAIYTRKSTEEGLEQEFNSLDAQREAGKSYITSQKHEGWQVISTPYDDAAYSGGNMERPALKKLLADIEVGKIDIVVVYKVDRLSRALSDFAKMVEIFDANSVSFVSVTQAFNTTTSMGRLTLNVLLSFAQFEREVTGERIRDKFAASKKKGMWMGGPQPLGYDVKDRKLIVNEDEAQIIQFIFEYYAKNPAGEPLYKLLDILKTKGYKGKLYTSKKGNQIIGKEFNLNQIYNILNNPLYNGKMKHKNEVYDGEHAAIIDDELWHKVHNKITKKEFTLNPSKTSEQPKLTGKIYDYLGYRLSPTYSYKYSAAGRYKMRYYINREISVKGKTISDFKRIRADYIDDIITKAIMALLKTLIDSIVKSANHELSFTLLRPLKQLVTTPIEFLEKITLFPQHMKLDLNLDLEGKNLGNDPTQEIKNILQQYNAEISATESCLKIKLNIPAQYKKVSGQLQIITGDGQKSEEKFSSEYSHSNDKTFSMLAKSFYWHKQIEDRVYKTHKEIAAIDGHNTEYVKRALKLKFLSPKIIKQITSNDNPNQINIEQLIACNAWNWREQEKLLLTQ